MYCVIYHNGLNIKQHNKKRQKQEKQFSMCGIFAFMYIVCVYFHGIIEIIVIKKMSCLVHYEFMSAWHIHHLYGTI